MKRHWLRGMLLGVSLALLLAGGVALAQGNGTARADKECVECIPLDYWQTPAAQIPYDPYGVTIRGTGWPPGVPLDHALCWPNLECWGDKSVTTDANGRFTWVPGGQGFWCHCPAPASPSGYGAEASAISGASCAPTLGTMEFMFYDHTTEHEAIARVLLAEDCPEEEAVEFVPEPGSIALLGSGLAGLAGYATLRWRPRS